MPEDMDIYMKKIKQRAEETDNVMGKIKADRMAELDKLRLDTELEEVRARLEENRAKIRESKQAGQPLAPQQAYNFAELLFAGRPPEEVKQIIGSLTEEEIQKLAYMASAMNNSKLSEFTALMRQPSTSMKEVVEAVKLGTEIARPQQQPQGSISDIAKSMAEMFKAGVEIGRGQVQPQQPQDPMQIYKVVSELVRPFQDEARAREKEANELRYKQLESKIVNPIEYVKTAKAVASELGMGSGGTTELDLKREEMQQTERLDNRRMEFEQKKWEYEKDNEVNPLEVAKEILTGPVGDVIKNIGSAGADRVRGSAPKATGGMVSIECPSCKGSFMANPNLPKIGCPNCGAQLERMESPPASPATSSEPQARPPDQPTPQENPQPQPQQNQVVVTNIGDLNKHP